MSLAAASAQAPICPLRPIPGDPIYNPLDLYSQNGVLTVNLKLQNAVDINGFMHYCYVYMNQGQQIEAPTLRLNPGDTLVMNLTNNLQAPYGPVKAKPMQHAHGAGQPSRRLQRQRSIAVVDQYALPRPQCSAGLPPG